MSWIRKNRYRGLFASLLIAVFFASQAFSCCLVNRKLGQFILSSLIRQSGMSVAHSCCPSAQTSNEGHESHNTGSQSGGCCIQDSNQKLPQMSSEQSPVPDLAGPVIDLLPMLTLDAPSLPTPPSLQSRSSPPVYLTNLRLLI